MFLGFGLYKDMTRLGRYDQVWQYGDVLFSSGYLNIINCVADYLYNAVSILVPLNAYVIRNLVMNICVLVFY